jgi:phage internal scaffolding protein
MELQKRFVQIERPVVDFTGDAGFTKQSFKDECDVNKIIPRYEKTGILTHLNKIEGRYGDITGVDFQTAQDIVVNATQLFDSMPSNVRHRFNNSPRLFLDFMHNPDNADEMVKLGLATLKESEEFKEADAARKVEEPSDAA